MSGEFPPFPRTPLRAFTHAHTNAHTQRTRVERVCAGNVRTVRHLYLLGASLCSFMSRPPSPVPTESSTSPAPAPNYTSARNVRIRIRIGRTAVRPVPLHVAESFNSSISMARRAGAGHPTRTWTDRILKRNAPRARLRKHP